MQINYIEIVTRDVDATCATYEQLEGTKFGEGDANLGNARTAALENGGVIGVRAPMHAAEEPVVRTYLLVEDIDAAVAAAVKAGGQVVLPAMEIPDNGKIAIFMQGGTQHGLWQAND